MNWLLTPNSCSLRPRRVWSGMHWMAAATSATLTDRYPPSSPASCGGVSISQSLSDWSLNCDNEPAAEKGDILDSTVNRSLSLPQNHTFPKNRRSLNKDQVCVYTAVIWIISNFRIYSCELLIFTPHMYGSLWGTMGKDTSPFKATSGE